jgi:hypothetical protein
MGLGLRYVSVASLQRAARIPNREEIPHCIQNAHFVRANTSSPTQGSTIEHGGERAGASLSSMGWTGKRGDGLPPVWVVVHRV